MTMTDIRSCARPFASVRRRVLGAGTLLGLAALAAMSGCRGHGQHTSAAIRAAEERTAIVKSGVTWQQAQQQFLAGNLERALSTINTAIEINPNVARSHVLRGRILMEMGQLEAAYAAFTRAEQLDPSNVESRYYRGIVHERFSQPEEALECYRAAMELDRTNPQYVVAAGEMLVTLRRLDEATALLESGRAGFTHNAGIRQLLGQIAALRGDYAESARLLHEARLLAPDDDDLLEELIRAQIAAGQGAEAHLNLTALMRSGANAERRDLRLLQARALVLMRRFAEARSILLNLTAERDGEHDLAAWVELGEVCLHLEDWDRLRLITARIISLAPTRPDGYLQRAVMQRRTGQLEQALLTLGRAVGAARVDARLVQLEALTLSDLGRHSEAIMVAEQLSRATPPVAGAEAFVESLRRRAQQQTATVPTP
jgi:tetratricopeptide (TPR) repeat protein